MLTLQNIDNNNSGPLSFVNQSASPFFLVDERGIADTGQFDDLCMRMVDKQNDCMVKLSGVELGRTVFTEIRVGDRTVHRPYHGNKEHQSINGMNR